MTDSLPGSPMSATGPTLPAVSLVTLGCARNEVDSEELAARFERGGFRLVRDPADADAVVVNTCGFVEAAKKDSVDVLLEAADLKAADLEAADLEAGVRPRAVLAVGCLAERYGKDLAESLPEADAVLGFDDYPDIADRVRSILDGHAHLPHTPRDRRALLPLSPVQRSAEDVVVPGHASSAPDLPVGLAPASGPRALRRRLGDGPVSPLKLASGCDRRCTFCAIPAFRGAFVSRRPSDILAEANWLGGQGVRELFLVSENSTSYGKDLGDLRLLETLLPELAAVPGVRRVRVSYLQPAEMRPTLVEALTHTPGVTPYFDLSFQHASGGVLRRMKRFGDAERFLELLDRIRQSAPPAGVRSNFIVGFPGETEDDLATLCDFLSAARLDAVGIFGYSDEDGTEAAGFSGQIDPDDIRERTDHVSRLADELTAQRAEDRVGEVIEVLVEQAGDGSAEGRAAHQGPDTDGSTALVRAPAGLKVGSLVRARVLDSRGVDLVADPLEVVA